jgi:tetratricopeptide (TPR) repeat protein
MKHKGEMPQNPKELNTQISDDLNRVILRCLEKDKEKRYQSAGEVLSELSNIEKGIPTTERIVPQRKPLTSREITVTFGLRKLLIPVLIFLGIIAGGILLWRFGLKKEAVLLPSEKHTIAVISFENMTGDPAFDHLRKIIPNLLITSLEQSGYFQVTTWERMYDLLMQMGKEEVEFIDRNLGFELCRMEGIDTIVLGSFGRAGDMFATDAKVLDVASKKLLKSASSRGEGEGSILKTQIDELSEEISKGIGVPERKIEAAPAKIAEVTTSSIKAYDYYLKGMKANEKLYYDEARQYFEKAVELDPNFASAYLYLASSYQDLGNTKSRNEAIDKAMLLSEKASKKERLYIEVWHSFFRAGNPEKAEKRLRQLIEEFPKEKTAHYWLAVYNENIGLIDQAFEEYNKALELDPNYADAVNMIAYAYMDTGNYEKALECFQRYASLQPEDSNPIDSIAELYLRMGRLDGAAAKYKEALAIKPDFGSRLPLAYIYALREDYEASIKWIDAYIENAASPGIKAYGYVWKGFYHYWLGSLDHSLEYIRRAITLADSIDNVSIKADANLFLGWIHYDRGKLESSRQHFQISLDLSVKYRPVYKADYSTLQHFVMGFVDLKEGRVDAARSRFKEIESLMAEVQPWTKEMVALDCLEAEILAAEGFLEEAIAVCEKPTPLKLPAWVGRLDGIIYNIPFMRDTLARIYQKKGNLGKAIDAYERLITFDPKSKERRLIHPIYHYRLAKLFEQKDWPGKAIEHYEKFLFLWKDADPGIAEVEDARKRLAGLKE